MSELYSQACSIACEALDRVRFVIKNCYVPQAAKIQIEAIEKNLLNLVDLLGGKNDNTKDKNNLYP